MNESNHLENLLRCWKPRRPSPNLKEQLFARSTDVVNEDRLKPALQQPETAAYLPPWRWWAPATALLIGTLSLLTGQFTATNFAARSPAHLIATAALSQPNLVAYLPAAGHTEHNAWPKTSFEWTNQGSLIAFTNGMIP